MTTNASQAMSRACRRNASHRDDYLPRNFRIYTHTTKNRILHIEDALEIGQIRFDFYAFRQGQGTTAQAEAYVEVDEARLLFDQMRTGRLPARFQAIGGRQRGEIVSRVLTVEEVQANNPIKITVQNGAGVPQDNGLITPAWWGNDGVEPQVDIAILLDRRTARKLALAVLDHLTAWAAATYYQRVVDNTWQPTHDACVDPETGEIFD